MANKEFISNQNLDFPRSCGQYVEQHERVSKDPSYYSLQKMKVWRPVCCCDFVPKDIRNLLSLRVMSNFSVIPAREGNL